MFPEVVFRRGVRETSRENLGGKRRAVGNIIRN